MTHYRVELISKEQCLREFFSKEAEIKDSNKGYIVIKGLNHRIDTKFLGYAADLIASWASKLDITAVGPIYNQGSPLATVVAERLGADLLSGRKDTVAPGSWPYAIVSGDITSFTTDKIARIMLYPPEPKDNTLLVDDFLASAETTKKTYRAVAPHVKRLHVAYYAAKNFDIGPEQLKKEGIDYFAAIEVASIANGRIILAPPHFTP